MSSYVATVVPKINREHILKDSSMLSKCMKYEKRKKKLDIYFTVLLNRLYWFQCPQALSFVSAKWEMYIFKF